MHDTNRAKATIINLDTQARIECMFNPKEYTFAKQNTWTQGQISGANTPQLTFGGGQPATLQMQLFFDTYSQAQDVRAYTDPIWELLMVNERFEGSTNTWARPPTVRFQWGQTWLFDAVITSITQRFTLFLSTGTPVRATLDVSFRQVKDAKQLRPQNPTSGGVGDERFWTVKEGETLAWIAYKEYGDPNQWRLIAETNTLMSVRRLPPGLVLRIPHG
jgi:nucleoid-associated protein YgaU